MISQITVYLEHCPFSWLPPFACDRASIEEIKNSFPQYDVYVELTAMLDRGRSITHHSSECKEAKEKRHGKREEKEEVDAKPKFK